MSQIKTAATVCLMLLGLPVSSGFADDETTETLHNNTFQEFASVADCQYQGDCSVIFPDTTHIQTVITGVSCSFAIPSGTTIIFSSVGSNDANPRYFLQPFYYSYFNGSLLYGINAVTTLFLAKGDTPRVDVYTNGGAGTQLLCTISGYHS